jgi:hypothetical protein
MARLKKFSEISIVAKAFDVAKSVTLEIWRSAPHDDEILITKDGEVNMAKELPSKKRVYLPQSSLG